MLSLTNEHILILFVQPVLTHLLHGRYPELVIHQEFDTLILVRNFAERVGCEFSVTSGVKDLSNIREWDWRSFHLDDLVDLGPEELVSKTAYSVRVVKLLVQ